ncbi:MAG: acetylglutamate kinase [Acidimicrobiaceae bacterium]|jgi:acetylglutamate kinase|nr:acetylglutamate kinase [Acidimicrobiaceae bacterium]MCH2633871.1 acetylglutamate kinase [Acidimicrobiales bacterium]HBV25927.1 acetylglutamate kinase [Acidimicrobiaceae bacterium]HCK75505.1 acetylglutamate kinase [Acidimicrobiaceae bacterium]
MSDKVPSLRLVDSDESSRAETTHRTVGQHLEQAELLVEILPYIQRWRGKVVVIKFGGNAMTDASLAERFAEDVVLMHQVGILPLIVHGGGPQIGELMERLGKEPEFKDGLRVTDAETLDIARMVLVGKVNREIVSSINVHGPLAVGVSGEDGGLITAAARNPELGFVGDVTAVDPTLLQKLFSEGLIPVMSTIGADETGQAYNINADTVAGAVAQAMEAEKVVYLTDVEGLYEDLSDETSLIRQISAADLSQKIQSGQITDGMIPKTEACVRAVQNGVTSAHLVDGRIPHVALLELFTDAGIGTMISD